MSSEHLLKESGKAWLSYILDEILADLCNPGSKFWNHSIRTEAQFELKEDNTEDRFDMAIP